VKNRTLAKGMAEFMFNNHYDWWHSGAAGFLGGRALEVCGHVEVHLALKIVERGENGASFSTLERPYVSPCWTR
jgi:hypothetical protein